MRVMHRKYASYNVGARVTNIYVLNCPITAEHLSLVSSDGVEWLFGAANVPQPQGGVIGGREKVMRI